MNCHLEKLNMQWLKLEIFQIQKILNLISWNFILTKEPSQYNNWISLYIWAGVPNAFISNNLSKICSNLSKSSSRLSKKPKNCSFHQTFRRKITIFDGHQLKCQYLGCNSKNLTQSRLFRLEKDDLDTNCQIKLILSQNWTQNVMMFDVEGFDIVTEKSKIAIWACPDSPWYGHDTCLTNLRLDTS